MTINDKIFIDNAQKDNINLHEKVEQSIECINYDSKLSFFGPIKLGSDEKILFFVFIRLSNKEQWTS